MGQHGNADFRLVPLHIALRKRRQRQYRQEYLAATPGATK